MQNTTKTTSEIRCTHSAAEAFLTLAALPPLDTAAAGRCSGGLTEGSGSLLVKGSKRWVQRRVRAQIWRISGAKFGVRFNNRAAWHFGSGEIELT